MRDIKFRGRRTDNGEWVYGDLTRYSKAIAYITTNLLEEELHEVDAKTVGQYTGLKDKFGKEIYEGDVVKQRTGRSYSEVRLVEFRDGAFRFTEQKTPHAGFVYSNSDTEVIGDIHTTPELLK